MSRIYSLSLSGLASLPVNTVAPVVSGTATVGQTLSCTTGTWTGSPTPTYTYQWRRDGSNIAAATASTYLLVQADATKSIDCVVTATNTAGAVPATSNALSPIYDAEAAAYITAASITDATRKPAINTFIAGVKSDLSLSLLTDAFDQLVLQANESAAAAVVDMCGRVNQTLVNSPTFTQWRGVKNNGVTDYIDTIFNPTTNASKYTQNSHAWGFYARTVNYTGGSPQNFSGYVSGANIRRVWPNFDGSHFVIEDSGLQDLTVLSNVNNTGLYCSSRTASNAFAFYLNGTSLATGSAATTAEGNLKFFLIGQNSAGSLSQCTNTGNEIALSYFARGMTSGEAAAFSARVATLKAAIGW